MTMSTAIDYGPADGFGPSVITLIRKELRELALPAVALVLCAVIIAGMDLVYNRFYQYRYPGIALSVWVVLSIAIALLGGGATIARENRERLIFLTTWPQSRVRLWLVKSAISFVVTSAVIALGLLVCLAAYHLRVYQLPYDPWVKYGGALQYLLLCFAMALLWSGLIRSVLGAAALGFASTCALVFGVLLFFGLYLPQQWGPYLGNAPSAGAPVSFVSDLASGLTLATLPLMVGGLVFARYPLLEGKRRLVVALGLLAGLTLILVSLSIAQMVRRNPPVLDRTVAETGLVNGGRYRYYLMPAHGTDAGGLWIAPANGGPAKRVARGKVYRNELPQDVLILTHVGIGSNPSNPTNWQVLFPSLHLKRLPDSPVYQPGQRPRPEGAQ